MKKLNNTKAELKKSDAYKKACDHGIVSMQFVIFKPLNYCFEETIGFDVKASFTSRPISRLISWYNNQVIQGHSVPRDFSWIENHKVHSIVYNDSITFLEIMNEPFLKTWYDQQQNLYTGWF